ncbi:hypothetical protein AB5N19_09410 [Seiridium cardinale]|uniref:Uncharacterized protein n=1 Tax=Seiridium cardinale TaxID=138064 RepID=A0ABR2Y848_9PEZI
MSSSTTRVYEDDRRISSKPFTALQASDEEKQILEASVDDLGKLVQHVEQAWGSESQNVFRVAGHECRVRITMRPASFLVDIFNDYPTVMVVVKFEEGTDHAERTKALKGPFEETKKYMNENQMRMFQLEFVDQAIVNINENASIAFWVDEGTEKLAEKLSALKVAEETKNKELEEEEEQFKWAARYGL